VASQRPSVAAAPDAASHVQRPGGRLSLVAVEHGRESSIALAPNEEATMAGTDTEERRRGIIWMIAGLVFLAIMFAGWWLVEVTNRQGTHDAELLPFFALIPLGIGAYHLIRSTMHHA
jgi:hypothetical protein